MFEKNRIIKYLYRWIRLSQEGVSVNELFRQRGISKCALYGYTLLTECLIYELNKTDIEVSFLIDRNADNLVISFPKYTLENSPLDKLDTILIMPVDDYEVIKKNVAARLFALGKPNIQLTTFEELIYEL